MYDNIHNICIIATAYCVQASNIIKGEVWFID